MKSIDNHRRAIDRHQRAMREDMKALFGDEFFSDDDVDGADDEALSQDEGGDLDEQMSKDLLIELREMIAMTRA